MLEFETLLSLQIEKYNLENPDWIKQLKDKMDFSTKGKFEHVILPQERLSNSDNSILK